MNSSVIVLSILIVMLILVTVSIIRRALEARKAAEVRSAMHNVMHMSVYRMASLFEKMTTLWLRYTATFMQQSPCFSILLLILYPMVCEKINKVSH